MLRGSGGLLLTAASGSYRIAGTKGDIIDLPNPFKISFSHGQTQ